MPLKVHMDVRSEIVQNSHHKFFKIIILPSEEGKGSDYETSQQKHKKHLYFPPLATAEIRRLGPPM